jgi:RimJ/RimL family protein N-acetyltransferase
MKLLLENQETERLRFRKLKKEDFAIWKELFDNETASRHLGMDHLNTADERCEYWFELTFNRYEKELGGQNVLIDKKTNNIVGQSGLLVRDLNGETEIEVAYSILPQYRKLGYAIEATVKCRDFAFEKKMVKQLYSIIHVENNDSKKVALRMGMEKVNTGLYGKMQADFFKINREDWEKIVA